MIPMLGYLGVILCEPAIWCVMVAQLAWSFTAILRCAPQSPALGSGRTTERGCDLVIYKPFHHLKLSTLGMGNMRLPTLGAGPIRQPAAHRLIQAAYAAGGSIFRHRLPLPRRPVRAVVGGAPRTPGTAGIWPARCPAI